MKQMATVDLGDMSVTFGCDCLESELDQRRKEFEALVKGAVPLKVVQISCGNDGSLYALCDDGSLWRYTEDTGRGKWSWVRLPQPGPGGHWKSKNETQS